MIELIIMLNGYEAPLRKPFGSVTSTATSILIIMAKAAGRVSRPTISRNPPMNSV